MASLDPPDEAALGPTPPAADRWPSEGSTAIGPTRPAGATTGLSAATWSALESVFHQAAALPETERRAFLDRACEGHAALRACAESLLALDPEASGWLRSGIHRAVAAVSRGEDWCGRRLGPYRLVRKLGEGGMGAVYLAERCDGEYEQRVAVKVVGSAPLREDLRLRFLVERQILARLEHPNIARFLGGGTTAGGVPYLVMEWVDGEAITAYCARRGLDLPERLGLFRQVLDAVGYAHRNLVVHRDLKPSNILVSEGDDSSRPASPPEPEPAEEGPPRPEARAVKLLDFGIAKLLDEERDPDLTHAGQRPMTPEYASPEQRLGLPVTTATDVYALGLVLYELLCGKRAFRPGEGTAEPLLTARPPRVPSQLADRETARRLRGELDRIALRAIAVDPAERYRSAAELDADLERYQRHQPVSAMPRAAPYLIRKFVVRNRKGLVAATLVLLALGWGIFAQSREAHVARAAEAETQLVLDYLVSLFEMAEPGTRLGVPSTLTEALDRAAASSAAALEANPRVRARLQYTLGKVYWNLGEYERSAELLRQALDLYTEIAGPESPAVGDTLYELGRTYQLLGRDEEAEAALRRSVGIRQRSGADLGVAAALSELSVLFRHLGRFDEAEQAARRAIAIRSASPDSPETDLASSLNHLASILLERDRPAEALPMAQRALEIRRRLFGPDDPDIATSLNTLGILHARLGEVETARGLFTESLEMRERILPEGHPSLGQSHLNLAQAELDLGRPERARPHLERAIEIWNGAPSPNLRRVGMAQALLGDLESTAGHAVAAERAYSAALETLGRGVGPDDLDLLAPLRGLAGLLCRQGRRDRATKLFDRALAIGRAHYREGHSALLDLEADRAACVERISPS